jgi:hypothetical protein
MVSFMHPVQQLMNLEHTDRYTCVPFLANQSIFHTYTVCVDVSTCSQVELHLVEDEEIRHY